MAKTLQECPTAGELWAAHMLAAPKPQRKSRTADALRACEADAHVLTAGARLLAANPKKKDAVRGWLEKAVAADASFGDAWVAYYQFERSVAKDEGKAAAVAARAAKAGPLRSVSGGWR
jgi:pre-mRNA-processing factor 6